MTKIFSFIFIFCTALGCAALEPAREPLLWPRPQSCIYSGETFKFQADAAITVQVSAAAAGTTALDHFSGLFLNQITAATVNTDGFVIALGDCTVPGTGDIPAEGYILDITGKGIVIAASDAVGLLNGVRTLRQLVTLQEEVFSVPCVLINDAPAIPVRGMHMMLLEAHYSEEILQAAKDYISALGQLKYNVVLLQLDALPDYRSVDLTSHITKWPMEKLAELGAHANAEGLEVVPVLGLGGHTHWFLRTPEYLQFWEKDGDRSINAMNTENSMLCPGQNEKLLPIIFGMIDELLEVFEPQRFHIAYDEIYLSDRLCPTCAPMNNHIQELYANQVNAIAAYLKSRGVKTVMWGDRPLSIPMRKMLGMDLDLAVYPMVQWLSPDNLEIMNWYYGQKREAFPTVVEYFREHGFYDQSLAVMCFDHNAENALDSAFAADVPAVYNTLWFHSNGCKAMQFSVDSWNNLPYFADLAWRGNEPDKNIFRNRLDTIRRVYNNDFPIVTYPSEKQEILYGDQNGDVAVTVEGVKVYPGTKSSNTSELTFDLTGKFRKIFIIADTAEIDFGNVGFTESNFAYPWQGRVHWLYSDGTDAVSPLIYGWNAGPEKDTREYFDAETALSAQGKTYRISVMNNPHPEKELNGISLQGFVPGTSVSAVTAVKN